MSGARRGSGATGLYHLRNARGRGISSAESEWPARAPRPLAAARHVAQFRADSDDSIEAARRRVAVPGSEPQGKANADTPLIWRGVNRQPRARADVAANRRESKRVGLPPGRNGQGRGNEQCAGGGDDEP